MKAKNIVHKALYVLGALLLTLSFMFSCTFNVHAKAEETSVQYTDVLEDLKKDETFDVSLYPAVATDYSLQVIQIAESVGKELFVYVYQPSAGVKDLTATTIRLSMPAVGITNSWKDYDLTLLNKDSVFQKYKVEGVTVKSDSVRYYDITAIHRKFDGKIDEAPTTNTENTINEIACPVGQQWTALTIDNVVSYSMIETEIIVVTNKVVGYIRYHEGFKLYTDRCDSHFVAFDTDRSIERLIEADVAFATQEYSAIYGIIGGSGEPNYKDPVDNFVSLSEIDTASNDADGLFGKKYTWNRIEKVSSFLSAENLDNLNLDYADIEDLKEMKWILRFVETDYTSSMNSSGVTSVFGTKVSEVTILRLYFETDGIIYNLGVVDNKTTGSDTPFAEADTYLDDFVESLKKLLKDGLWWLYLLLIIILVGVLLAILVPVIIPLVKSALKLIGKAIKWMFKALWWLICLPFNLIGKLFRRKDKNEYEDKK